MEQIIDPRADIARAATTAGPTVTATAAWPAIFAGAFVAIAATLIFLALGSGIGFASVSPWPDRGITATSFAITTAIWLVVTQWISSALGGYIAGRLRTRWVGTHAHEVFFRDTAHGLVTWALATVVVATVAAMSVSSGVGAGAHAAGEVAAAGVQGASQGAAQGAAQGGGSAYGVDKLFRPATGSPAMTASMMMAGPPAGTPGGPPTGSSAMMTGPSSMAGGAPPPPGGFPPGEARAEASHIVANAMATGSIPDADKSYLVSQVAARSGVSQSEAQARVDDLVAGINAAQTKLKADADAARKATSEASIYLALSMLLGAFIASVSAALGGRLRDEHI